ncbi:MAG: SusC/RagA family TonB-linked outer membrane protein [Sphingobacteriales bacterium]|nr:MAG: SusC/RagA family TonB-linked outer membrane protein [Sphingobacteriales bacterium]
MVKVNFGNVTVTGRFIGYTLQKKSVAITETPQTVNFNLVPDSKALDEVVVIGYGAVKKKDLTGAVTVVTAKDFQNGNIVSPEQLIAGKVAGVQITSNGGAPGSGSTIRIRGGASLNASNDPLIVIDGVPITDGTKKDGKAGLAGAGNPLSLINPNEIETFTVLKDASATAIYGSRASNGVIIITTKKGSSGAPTFNFSSQVANSTLSKQINVLNADEIRNYVNNNPNATPAQKASLGTANTNWQDEIYRSATSTDNNLSVAGTFDKIPYRVSLGYLNQQGVLLNDKLSRTSGAISLSPRLLNNNLKIDLNLKGSLSKSSFGNTGAVGAALSFDPSQPVRTNSPAFDGYFEFVDANGGINNNAPRNPVALIKQKEDNSKANRSFGNLQLDYTLPFLPELRANLNLGYDIATGRGGVFVPAVAAQNFGTQGSRTQYLQEVNNKIGEFYLNYTKDLKSIKSNINVTTGYGYYDNRTKNTNFASLRADESVLTASIPKFPFDIPRNNLQSYYGRMIYTYNDRYILSASIRTDGSSRFSPDKRWGVFPSASLTWRVQQESFLRDVNALSDLKIRLSYGITGQQDGIANYSYLPNYAISSNEAQYQIGDKFYNMSAPLAYDKNIKWEETATTNLGIDYGFLNNRITGSVDAYIKKTKDLLATIPIPVGSNFSNLLLTNVGNIQNRGVEFSLNAQPIQTKDFRWSVGLNATFNEVKIENLTASPDPNFNILVGDITGGTGQTAQTHSVGYNPFAFYVYKQVYSKAGKPLEGVYEDLNGDGKITPEGDLYRYKSPVPTTILGFNTQFDYKKWSLNTVLRANLGNYMYNNVASNFGVERNVLNPTGFIGNTTQDIFNSGFVNNQYLSDYYVENASFLRMDNLGIGYTVGNIIKGSKSNLRLAVNCQNVFVVTKYKGLDPEVSGGIDYTLYPRPRTYSFGFNPSF